jgi:3-methyladenine DNA glycosylase AlkD
MNQYVKNRLSQMTDEKYRIFQTGLLPGISGITGVRLPALRQLAKKMSNDERKAYLASATDDSFEEILFQGIVIGLEVTTVGEGLNHVRNFVPKINNWAVCDSFCGGLKMTRRHQPEMLEFLRPYLTSDQEFELRFAVVMLLCYYIDDSHIGQVLSILGTISHEAYYVKMAVAWTLSICFVHYPEKTMDFLRQNNLDDFTYNKSLQKIIESRRVDSSTKAMLKLMKRKSKVESHVTR